MVSSLYAIPLERVVEGEAGRQRRTRSGPIQGIRKSRNQVLSHPFVIGELACGTLANRKEILSLLKELPEAATATHGEVLGLIESQRLMGIGLGYVDVQLPAAARLSGVSIWTEDRSLKAAAARLMMAFQADS